MKQVLAATFEQARVFDPACIGSSMTQAGHRPVRTIVRVGATTLRPLDGLALTSRSHGALGVYLLIRTMI